MLETSVRVFWYFETRVPDDCLLAEHVSRAERERKMERSWPKNRVSGSGAWKIRWSGNGSLAQRERKFPPLSLRSHALTVASSAVILYAVDFLHFYLFHTVFIHCYLVLWFTSIRLKRSSLNELQQPAAVSSVCIIVIIAASAKFVEQIILRTISWYLSCNDMQSAVYRQTKAIQPVCLSVCRTLVETII